MAAGFLGSFPISFSDSRTAINLSVGCHFQLAGLVSAAALIVMLLFLNDALRILPVAALAAILVSAALSLIDIQELRQIWRISRAEFVFAIITMWGAISFGVLNGVVIAIAATLVYLIRNMMFPRDVFLGLIPSVMASTSSIGFRRQRPFPALSSGSSRAACSSSMPTMYGHGSRGSSRNCRREPDGLCSTPGQ